MSDSFYYIAEGKAYFHSNGRANEIRSRVLESYIDKVKESAKRNEWKYSGTGAAFTGTYQPHSDAESRVSSVFSRITCLRPYKGDLLYSLTIDRTNGIYKKTNDDAVTDGIVLSSADNAYCDFDVSGGKLVLSSSFAGESHIGVMELSNGDLQIYTEGHSFDHSPVWSKRDGNKIYFCCTGLPIENREEPRSKAPMSYSELVSEMYSSAKTSERGATSICLLDIEEGTLDELLTDQKYDYTHPQSTSDGSLYYIRKPHRSEGRKTSSLGCLVDLFMFPFRLIGALFGFLNVFSAKYSGKTLSKSGDVKNRNEREMFIDGNLINAEKELKANKSRGEKNPGIIPHSWELRRLDPDGKDHSVRGGVAAFFADESDGTVLVSNGSAILRIDSDGKEEKICSAANVTAIYR